MAITKDSIYKIDKEELGELIEKLDKIRGRHTELVSVYIPAGHNINTVADQIESEKSTAKNIKSKTTQKNVVEALERIGRQLKQIQQTPSNGLVLFSGNVSQVEGQEDHEIWVIEPPEPLGARLYRCDQVFVLDPLKELLEIKEIYGLFVIDRREATIGLLEGKRIIVLEKLESGVPGKVAAGGQSAARYSRVIEGKARDFYKKCALALKTHFFDLAKLKGIIIGGPIPTKDDFVKDGGLVTALRDKIIGMKDIGYTDEHGLELLVGESQDILAEQEIIHEKKILENFFNMLGKFPKKTAYGLEPVKKALNLAAVDTLFLSRNLKKSESHELKLKAEGISSNIEIISVDTVEGQQFWNLSGVGAILRYELNLS